MVKNKSHTNNIIALNKKAYSRYQILDKIEAGIVLTGPETKSVKNHQIHISDSYAKIINNELYLINAHISPYKFSREEIDPKRSRKLLLKRTQISHLIGKTKMGLTIIPLKVYLKKSLIKVELGLAKGLKLYDKKRLLKEKEIQKEASRELKRFN